MSWMLYAAGAAVFLGIADCMIKLAAGKLPNSLGLLLYGCVPFTAGLIWFLFDRAKNGPMVIQPRAPFYGVAVGCCFTMVTILMYLMFRAGAPISLASPAIRLAGLLLASVAGVLIWQEAISARYVCGMLFTAIGIYLILKN